MFWDLKSFQEIRCEVICLIVVAPQLQNGASSQLGPVPTSFSALGPGETVSTEHAGDIHISSHSTASNAACQRDGPGRRSRDAPEPQSGPTFAREQDVGAGKRKLPSPEGGARQGALPQPQTGNERRWQEGGDEEEEQKRASREGGLGQKSENYMNQENRPNQDHQQSSLGKNGDSVDLVN